MILSRSIMSWRSLITHNRLLYHDEYQVKKMLVISGSQSLNKMKTLLCYNRTIKKKGHEVKSMKKNC